MTLQEALENIVENGQMEFSVSSYSGRGMYGKTCLAIDGDDINTIELGYRLGELAEAECEDWSDDLRGMRSDSMGMGMVYYWPRVPFVGTESVSEDDD